MPHPASRTLLALIVAGNRWFARSLDSILENEGFAVLHAGGGEQALALSRRVAADVFLIDAALPDTGAIELIHRLRVHEATAPTTPILIASEAAVGREARLASLRAGAWDHLVFPLDAEELLLKLRSYLQAKATADAAWEAGLVDAETGVYSTRGLLRRIQELGAAAKRTQSALACITVAPDPRLQPEIRETAAATQRKIARQIGSVLGCATRASDCVGRMSRSDFVVVAPETDAPGAVQLAQRLLAAFDAAAADPSDTGPTLRLRAGCYGVSNFGDAAIEPVEMVVRSTLALRESQAERTAAARIQLFRAAAVMM